MLRIVTALLFGLAVSPAALGQNMVERFQQGLNYFLLDPAQPTPANTVEVTEVFSYACIHCAHFQPVVDKWKKTMPASASFTYLPAAWNPGWEMMARVFYAAEALGIKERTHAAFFNAVHVEHKHFATLDDVAQWYASNAGVNAADFIATANSTGVAVKVARSKQMVPRYQIEGTPTVIVAGKYRVTGQAAGGWDQVMDVVDFLIAKETAARKTTAKSG